MKLLDCLSEIYFLCQCVLDSLCDQSIFFVLLCFFVIGFVSVSHVLVTWCRERERHLELGKDDNFLSPYCFHYPFIRYASLP